MRILLDYFQRNIAVQHLIVTAVDDTHSPFTDLCHDPIMTEYLTDHWVFLPHLISISAEIGSDEFVKSIWKSINIAAYDRFYF